MKKYAIEFKGQNRHGKTVMEYCVIDANSPSHAITLGSEELERTGLISAKWQTIKAIN